MKWLGYEKCKEGGGTAETKKPMGVVLIAVVNVLIYATVLALTLNFVGSAHPYYGSGWLFVDLVALVGTSYAVVGIMGVLGLFTHSRIVWYLAIAGWILECIGYSVYGYFASWSTLYNYTTRMIDIHYPVILAAAAVIAIKIASIAYFFTKKVKQAYHT